MGIIMQHPGRVPTQRPRECMTSTNETHPRLESSQPASQPNAIWAYFKMEFQPLCTFETCVSLCSGFLHPEVQAVFGRVELLTSLEFGKDLRIDCCNLERVRECTIRSLSVLYHANGPTGFPYHENNAM